jgi:hypothetical protein
MHCKVFPEYCARACWCICCLIADNERLVQIGGCAVRVFEQCAESKLSSPFFEPDIAVDVDLRSTLPNTRDSG